jgi:hypothetical protein
MFMVIVRSETSRAGLIVCLVLRDGGNAAVLELNTETVTDAPIRKVQIIRIRSSAPPSASRVVVAGEKNPAARLVTEVVPDHRLPVRRRARRYAIRIAQCELHGVEIETKSDLTGADESLLLSCQPIIRFRICFDAGRRRGAACQPKCAACDDEEVSNSILRFHGEPFRFEPGGAARLQGEHTIFAARESALIGIYAAAFDVSVTSVPLPPCRARAMFNIVSNLSADSTLKLVAEKLPVHRLHPIDRLTECLPSSAIGPEMRVFRARDAVREAVVFVMQQEAVDRVAGTTRGNRSRVWRIVRGIRRAHDAVPENGTHQGEPALDPVSRRPSVAWCAPMCGVRVIFAGICVS